MTFTFRRSSAVHFPGVGSKLHSSPLFTGNILPGARPLVERGGGGSHQMRASPLLPRHDENLCTHLHIRLHLQRVTDRSRFVIMPAGG